MLLSPFYRWKKIKFREVKEPTQNHTASNDRCGWHKFLVLRTLQWKVFECIKWLSTYLSNKKVKECQALGYESIKALFCSRSNFETRAGKDELVTWSGVWKQKTAFTCSERDSWPGLLLGWRQDWTQDRKSSTLHINSIPHHFAYNRHSTFLCSINNKVHSN